MKVRTHIKAGRLASNHNETVARSKGIRLKSGLRAGRISSNHNETLTRARL